MKILSPSLLVLGAILNIAALFQLIPGVLSLVLNTGDQRAFFLSAAISSVSGLVCYSIGHLYRTPNMIPRQMFLITAIAWVALPIFGSLPFVFSSQAIPFTDAVFEAVSGMTTTGSTVLVNLDKMPKDLLLWRSLLQWIGGLGIIGMAIAVLPFLSVGGMKLFRTESSDWSDKSLPRTQELIKQMMFIYVGLTVVCIVLYVMFGMDLFNAINHAFTTIATGGYSTSDSSFAQFSSPMLHWIAIVFMILGSAPFYLYIRIIRHRNLKMFRDTQFNGMLLIMLLLTAVLTLVLYLRLGEGFWRIVTLTAFNLVSVMTTTGYASDDYSLWGGFAVALFFFVTFIGGCSGSTSGGVKVFRVQLCFTIIREQIARAIHPRATLPRIYNGVRVSDEILTSLVAFLFVMIISLAVLTLLLALTGLDLVTSLTSSSSALMNVGPGLGSVVGPAGNFSSLSDVAKWLLCLGMIMGRLEFLTIIVLFSPAFWRN
ncbi:MAG: TrkH family potassium uptake protein [Gammaproteobacteria bacterium]